MFSSIQLYAQDVSGLITSEDDLPISGAIVKIVDSDYKLIDYTQSKAEGVFKFNLDINTSPAYLLINHINYLPDTFKLSGDLKEIIVIKLKRRVFELPEVEIQEGRQQYENSGDTTRFDVRSFQNGHERSLEEVLKKLPGVDISSDGTIYFRGKMVSNVLIEEDDLFGKKYAMGTKSMNPDYISEFEFIDKYEKENLLRGISDSDELVLNLKLDDSFKLAVFGDAEIGLGLPKRYLLRGNIFSMQQSSKSLALLNSNNVNYEAFDLMNYMENGGGAFDDLKYNRTINMLYGGKFYQRRGLPFELQSLSNNNTATISNISNIGKIKSNTKLNLSFIKNRFRETVESTYLGQNISFFEVADDTLSQEGALLFNELSLSTSERGKVSFRTELSFRNLNTNNYQQLGILDGSRDSVLNKGKGSAFRQAYNLQYLHQINPSHVISLNYTFINQKWSERGSNRLLSEGNVAPDSFFGINSFSQSLDQGALDHSFSVNWISSFSSRLKTNIGTGVSLVSDRITSELFQEEEQDTLKMAFERKYIEPYVEGRLTYQLSKKSNIRAGAKLSTANISTRNQLFFNTNLSHQALFSDKLKMISTLGYSKRPVNAVDVSNLIYYADFRSLIQRNAPINELENGFLLNSLVWSVPKKMIELQWTVTGLLQKLPVRLINQESLASDQEYVDSFYQPSLNTVLSFDKYLKGLKANLNLTADYYRMESDNQFNEFNNFKTENYSLGASLSTNTIGFFNVVFSNKIIRNTISSTNQDAQRDVNSNLFLETKYGLAISPLNKNQLRIELNSVSYNSLSGSFDFGNNQFLELRSSYNFNDRHNVVLNVENIFNKRAYQNDIVNTFSRRFDNVSVQGTFFYVSYFFRFST